MGWLHQKDKIDFSIKTQKLCFGSRNTQCTNPSQTFMAQLQPSDNLQIQIIGCLFLCFSEASSTLLQTISYRLWAFINTTHHGAEEEMVECITFLGESITCNLSLTNHNYGLENISTPTSTSAED